MLQHTVVGIIPGIFGVLKEAMEGITAVYNKIQVCVCMKQQVDTHTKP